VFSLYTFIPDHQVEKIEIIADIRKRIDRKRTLLSRKNKEIIDEWYHYLTIDAPFDVSQLPDWVTMQLRDISGNLGRFVIFWTRGPKADYRNAKSIYDSFFNLKIQEGEVPVAADYFVLPEIVDTIYKEGPILLALVALCMIVAAAILFRSLMAVLLICVTVLLPLLWLLGIMRLNGWSLNFFNVLTFPLLIGIGQDDALHIYHRYREEGVGQLGKVLKETGGAIFMTTWTTIIGFTALLFANHQGLMTLARLTILGLTLCFVSSVCFLPGVITIGEWLNNRRQNRKRIQLIRWRNS
jgi:preprotein translocase subunit SecF